VMTYVQNILMASENNHKSIKGVNENRENWGRIKQGNKAINEHENIYCLGIMYFTWLMNCLLMIWVTNTLCVLCVVSYYRPHINFCAKEKPVLNIKVWVPMMFYCKQVSLHKGVNKCIYFLFVIFSWNIL
jgi:hypothetical protein